MKICAYIPVFNEEYRIKYILESVKWCDQIIIIDKESTDRTVELAKSYGADVYVMQDTPYYNDHEFDYLDKCKCEWVLIVTASDIIDIKLAYEIKRLLNLDNFDYDKISVPYKRYVLGINNKYSPWYGESCSPIMRVSTLKLNHQSVHGLFYNSSCKEYKIKYEENMCISHLTHETVDIMMERHIRYWRAEGNKYQSSKLTKAFKDVFSGIKFVFLKRKCFLGGIDTISLMFAYMSYFLMSFVYKWENKRCNAKNIYKELRERNYNNWEQFYNDNK